MDTQADYQPFVALLGELCEAFNRPYTDELAAAYWKALKDCKLSDLRAAVLEIIQTASDKTHFPRPGTLRARIGAVSTTAGDGALQAGMRTNAQTWRELKARDPIEFEIQYRIAFAARMTVVLPHGDVAFQAWERELQHWQSLRFGTREAKQAAIAKALPLEQWARTAA